MKNELSGAVEFSLLLAILLPWGTGINADLLPEVQIRPFRKKILEYNLKDVHFTAN